MAVRQYIGARYTIKVYENSVDPSTADWQSGVAYEPITLVTYNNSSYLSKKAVPASVGNPASNPSYWVCTGYYNGQIMTLQSQIDALNSALDELNVRSGNGKILMIGDSIGVATNTDGKTFFELFAAYAGHTVNSDAFISSISSRGFTTAFATYGNFKIMFDQFWVDHPTLDPNDFSDIIVCGGANDQSSTVSTITAAISAFCADVKATCPNAEIYIGVCTRNQVNSAGSTAFRTVALPAYKDCIKYGAKYLSGLEFVLFNSALQADKLHPNSDGVNALATGLYQAFTTGQAHIMTALINTNDNVTLGEHVTSISNIAMFSEVQEDDIVSITPNGFSTSEIVLDSAQTFGALAIFTMDDNIWYNTSNLGLGVMHPDVKVTHSDNSTEILKDVSLYKTLNVYVIESPTGFSDVTKIAIMRPDTVTRSALWVC